MKRLFRPRNLFIVLAITGIVFFVVKKKQSEQQLAGMNDDQVRDMVHDRVAGKVDAATESEITEKVIEKKEELVSKA